MLYRQAFYPSKGVSVRKEQRRASKARSRDLISTVGAHSLASTTIRYFAFGYSHEFNKGKSFWKKIMEWYCLNLGDANISQPMLYDIAQELEEIFKKAGHPPEMIAASRYESNDLHCQIKIFLTSDFQKYAKLDGMVNCPQPNKASVSYLAGEKSYWHDV